MRNLNILPMRNVTTFQDGESVESMAIKPKKSTLDLIRQFARVYTPITTIAFSQLIAN